MLSQNDTFSISNTFAIAGGAATTATGSTATPATISSTTLSTKSTARATSTKVSSAAPSSTGDAADLQNKGGSSPHEKLTTGGIVGVVIGIVAIFIMFLALCVFAVATKKLGPGSPPPGAGSEEADDQTNLRGLHDDMDGSSLSMSEVAAGKQVYRKRSGSDGEGSQASNYSTSLSSPDTLVPTPARRMEADDLGQSLNNSRAPSIQNSPLRSNPANMPGMQGQMANYEHDGAQVPAPLLQGNWMHDDWVQRQAYAMPAPVPISHGQPRVVGLSPQYTGESSVSTLAPESRSRSSSGGSINGPQVMQRRLSPTSPPVAPLGPSKLRTQFDVDEQ
jgi:hypothetical protein